MLFMILVLYTILLVMYIRYDVDQICVETSKAVHVGDDSEADKAGANAVGIDCWWVV